MNYVRSKTTELRLRLSVIIFRNENIGKSFKVIYAFCTSKMYACLILESIRRIGFAFLFQQHNLIDLRYAAAENIRNSASLRYFMPVASFAFMTPLFLAPTPTKWEGKNWLQQHILLSLLRDQDLASWNRLEAWFDYCSWIPSLNWKTEENFQTENLLILE